MRIGVDLGGTKIEAIALADDGRVLARERVPAPRGVYRATIEAIVALVSTVRTRAGNAQASVGIGIPGAVSPATGLVKNANSTWLIGRPLERDLAESLGQAVRIENDANCFAVSEATDGAAAGASVVFGVILGTGVGAGIVVDGRGTKPVGELRVGEERAAERDGRSPHPRVGVVRGGQQRCCIKAGKPLEQIGRAHV